MMVDRGTSGRGRRWLRSAASAALCLAAVWAVSRGLHWYWATFIVSLAFVIAIGRRSIFRIGVSRTPYDIVCRYIPWYEGSAYFLLAGLPLIAVAMISASYDPPNPVWLRFGGIILLVLMPVVVYSYVTIWRRSSLQISPSALTVRLAASKDGPVDIPREHVRSITPKLVPNSVSGAKALQVEISYDPSNPNCASSSVLLGLQLTVQPNNLLDALLVWRAAVEADPRDLMDRVEHILRYGTTPDELAEQNG